MTGMSNEVIRKPPDRAVILHNETCPYCGIALTRETRTKEHVVGRRFVPRGTLHQHWNLIVWACEPCNRRKAELEDDLSAISMQPDPWGEHARDDVRLRKEAVRKAKTKSRRSGKPVKDSQEQFSISQKFGGAEFTFNFTSAPQADEHRIVELARMQVMAFFYWITIQEGEVNGRFWPGKFFPLQPVLRSDWGNDELMFFVAETKDWDWRVHAVTADGYFKLAIKKHPDRLNWSFAVEWNESYRIVGFFGDTDWLHEIRDRVPQQAMETIYARGDEVLRQRREVPLPSEDDMLFAPPHDAWGDVDAGE